MPVATASIGGLGFQQMNYLTGGAGRVSLGAGGVNPGATAVDSVLAAVAIPGGLFDGISNRGVKITAFGSFATNANVKTVKIIYNPATAVVGSTVGAGGTTLVASPGATASNQPWFLEASVVDVAGVNNQLGFALNSWFGIAGTLTDIAVTTPAALTADETKDILIAITGNAATTATDISLLYFAVSGWNQ
jgi:hypothetical protein